MAGFVLSIVSRRSFPEYFIRKYQDKNVCPIAFFPSSRNVGTTNAIVCPRTLRNGWMDLLLYFSSNMFCCKIQTFPKRFLFIETRAMRISSSSGKVLFFWSNLIQGCCRTFLANQIEVAQKNIAEFALTVVLRTLVNPAFSLSLPLFLLQLLGA